MFAFVALKLEHMNPSTGKDARGAGGRIDSWTRSPRRCTQRCLCCTWRGCCRRISRCLGDLWRQLIGWSEGQIRISSVRLTCEQKIRWRSGSCEECACCVPST